MQNYHQPPGYTRPGSTASFAGQPSAPPVPPPYGAPQGYQSASPQPQTQWAPPAAPAPAQQWSQPQQPPAAGGYNPVIYGAMPGAYAPGQGYQAPTSQPANPYAPQQHDQPPPPPPKPYGFAAAVQKQNAQNVQNAQNRQSWAQPPPPLPPFTPHAQQGGYPMQSTYNNTAPHPPPATPGSTYFAPSQGGRPGSMYGADQAGSYATPTPQQQQQQQPASVMSPNEQQPTYIPPSLSGQGVQAFMPSNTNPMPGVYVPPPPDIPAWQHAQQTLQQGGRKFTYTKPVVDPSFYAQGGGQQQQGQYHQQYAQPAQAQDAQQGQAVQQTQPVQDQLPHHQQQQQQQQQYYQHVHQQQFPGQPQQYNQAPQDQNVQQSAPTLIQQSQRQPPQDTSQSYNQYQEGTRPSYGGQQQHQQQWQTGYQAQNPAVGQENAQMPSQGNGVSNIVNESGIQSQTVSPINKRHSMSFAPGHLAGSGRTESVSSIALANLHSQRTDDRANSPKPPSFKAPTPPPPRDDKSKFSALGTGGPSDWEVFGAEDEVDDEDMFMKKNEKNEPAQLDSVELPAQPSPSSTHGWPSPAQSTVPPLSGERRDTYEPTPPPTTASLAPLTSSQVQNQSFIVNDAVVPLRTSPRPMQKFQPPSPQRSGFVMGEVLWDKSKQERSQHNAPPTQLSHAAPAQTIQHVQNQQHQPPPPIATGPARDGVEWGVSQQTPTQMSNAWGGVADRDYVAELRAKDEAFERSQAKSEQDMQELRAEIEKLKSNAKTAAVLAASGKNTLDQEIQEMRVAREQAKSSADGIAKEYEITLERIKEDVEGKEETIEEREATIADLRRELEAERTKESPEHPTPVPADLVPDIDPWYAGSLARYVAMLRSEAGEPQVEDKIKVFQAFLRAESSIRGLEYYNELPLMPVQESMELQRPVEQPTLSRTGSNASSRRRVLSVAVPQAPPSDDNDDHEYSPGGRPLLRRLTMPLQENVPQQPINSSAHSTTIMTPTSSVDDDSNKTPIQSTPGEQSQPHYKAYVPPAEISTHRQSVSFSNSSAVATPSSTNKDHDEIFFGSHQPQRPQSNSRPTSSDGIANVPIPAPLSFAANRPLSTAPPSKMDPIDALAKLLPSRIISAEPSQLIAEIRNKSKHINSKVDADELTRKWEKAASLTRKKNDDERRKRQEDNEEHNNELFDSEEISYAQISQLEEDLKEQENELKAQEDRDEYKGYVETVFDIVYDDIQAEIKALMDLYIEAENLLQASVSGVRSLQGGDIPTTKDSLSLLKDLHEKIEKNHARVHQAVADRDKRYKKTEVQPLYVAGNVTKMKALERHFDTASLQAQSRAASESAERTSDLIRVAEEVVITAVTTEQADLDRILSALRTLLDATAPRDLLARAHTTITCLKTSSKELLTLFHALERNLTAADRAVDVAHAHAEGADEARVAQIEEEAAAAETKLEGEFERRVRVLEQDAAEIEKLLEVKGKGEEVGEGQDSAVSAEKEKEKRLQIALETAKRRNGDV